MFNLLFVALFQFVTIISKISVMKSTKVQTLGTGRIGKGHAIVYSRTPFEEVKTLDIIYSD